MRTEPEAIPALETLTIDGLAAVIRNDTVALHDAGLYNVPAAIGRLRAIADDGEDGRYDDGVIGRARELLAELEPAAASADRDQADVDDVEATATITSGAGDLDATRLEAAGYQAIRGQVIGAAQGILALDVALIDELIAFAVAGQRKLEARGDVPRERLEAITNELGVLRAARHFHRELGKLAEGAEARARILGG